LDKQIDDGSPEFTSRVKRWIVEAPMMSVARLTYDKDDLPIAPASKREEALCVIVQLEDFASHRLWRNGRLLFEGGHAKSTIAITDLREEWQCHHLSAFDNIRFTMPLPVVRDFSKRIGLAQFDGFDCLPGTRDPVILGIAQAVLPYLTLRQPPSSLFFEQIGLLLLTHLSHAYAGQMLPARKRGMLAPWQEKRALEYLTTRAFSQVSIAELAETCGLSRNYFIRAFKETLGKTPYRWLTEYRVAKVKEMLLDDIPMPDVASQCGFVDQSHMTRVFQGVTGETPGKWRRKNWAGRDYDDQH